MSTSFRLARHPLGIAGAAVLALSACGGGGSSDASGTLKLSLTDAPACGYSAVNVTITKLSVHKSGTAAATDAGWVDIPIDGKRIDLLTLQNGVLATLGQTPLASGKYTQMRLLLADNASAAPGQPLPNSVVPTGGTEMALKTPSGQQTGLKLNVDIDIAADKLADFVIDFQVCKSVVATGPAGSVGRYLLKPVLSVTPQYVSGVKGSVDASIASGANTLVTLQQRGTATTPPVVVKGTAPDSSGNFVLAPVTPGTYDLVVTSNGHATAVVSSVVVATDTVTTVGSALAPAVSATGTIGGTVVAPVSTTIGGIDASAAVTQTLATGGTIAIAAAPVNSGSGAYAFTVPVGAVSVAPYAAGTLTFGSDTASAGKFTVAATAGDVTKMSGLLTLAAGATLSVTPNLTFP